MNSNLDINETRTRSLAFDAQSQFSIESASVLRHASAHDDYLSATMQKLVDELQVIIRDGLTRSMQQNTRQYLPDVAAEVGNRVGQAVQEMLYGKLPPGSYIVDGGKLPALPPGAKPHVPPKDVPSPVFSQPVQVPPGADDAAAANTGLNDPARTRMREFVTKALEKATTVFQAVGEGLNSFREFASRQGQSLRPGQSAAATARTWGQTALRHGQSAVATARTWAESLRPSVRAAEERTSDWDEFSFATESSPRASEAAGAESVLYQADLSINEALRQYARLSGPVNPFESGAQDDSPGDRLAAYADELADAGKSVRDPYLTATEGVTCVDNEAACKELRRTAADRVVLELPPLDGAESRWLTVLWRADSGDKRTWARCDTGEVVTQDKLMDDLNPGHGVVKVHAPSNDALRDHTLPTPHYVDKPRESKGSDSPGISQLPDDPLGLQSPLEVLEVWPGRAVGKGRDDNKFTSAATESRDVDQRLASASSPSTDVGTAFPHRLQTLPLVQQPEDVDVVKQMLNRHQSVRAVISTTEEPSDSPTTSRTDDER